MLSWQHRSKFRPSARAGYIGSRLLSVTDTGQQRQGRIGIGFKLGMLAHFVDFKMTGDTKFGYSFRCDSRAFMIFSAIEVGTHILQGLTASTADDTQSAGWTPSMSC